jgi:hypothetical protein
VNVWKYGECRLLEDPCALEHVYVVDKRTVHFSWRYVRIGDAVDSSGVRGDGVGRYSSAENSMLVLLDGLMQCMIASTRKHYIVPCKEVICSVEACWPSVRGRRLV